jgi:hypothetical protein
MATPRENEAEVKRLIAAVKDHCMCMKFEDEGDKGKYRVLYPYGYNYPGGVQVSQAMGKAKALAIILEKMELHWQESMWWKNIKNNY